MKAVIRPSHLQGTVKTVASKSQAHRMLICAAFADKPTDILCRELSQDIEATAKCLIEMGSDISYDRESGIFHVVPAVRKAESITIDVGESGSTLRFLLPVVCALGMDTHIVMHGRLSERPLSPLWEELEAHGAVLRKNADSTMDVSGRLKGSSYRLAADVSSQFISGMLFAAPLIADKDKDFELELTGNVESVNYILMTVEALKSFGVRVAENDGRITMKRDASYSSPGSLEVEGDWSNGAFWICGSIMTEGSISVAGLNRYSVQGDSAAAELARKISGRLPVIVDADGETTGGSREPSIAEVRDRCVVDARNVPDLVPVLSVLAASVKGETVFTHAERLRIKESDRIRATVSMLRALGADADETDDGIIVRGTGNKLAGGTVDSCNDHRIAMSAAIASLVCENEVAVLNAQAVRKSYPDFWKVFVGLGGDVTLTEE